MQSEPSNDQPAVLDVTIENVTIEMAPKASDASQNGKNKPKATGAPTSSTMRNVELTKETIQEGFGVWSLKTH